MSTLITIAQQKGGAGKTTIAAQLASAFRAKGFKVATIDSDPQASLTVWAEARGADAGLIHVKGAGYRGVSEARAMRRKADVVLIDTPPHNESATRLAVQNADLVLAPLQLSPFDLAASGATAEMIAGARKPFLFVLNRVPPRARIADQMREEFLAFDLPLAEAALGARAIYAETAALGRGVAEVSPRSKAGAEVALLAREVLALTLGEDAGAAAAA